MIIKPWLKPKIEISLTKPVVSPNFPWDEISYAVKQQKKKTLKIKVYIQLSVTATGEDVR